MTTEIINGVEHERYGMFLIPVNVAGEAVTPEEIEFEARQDEAEAFYNWMQQEAELERMDDEKNFGHNHNF